MSVENDELVVFISWSGERSKAMAVALSEWLPCVVQRVRPWISSHIPSGGPWRLHVARNLKRIDHGILCVTPENRTAPWLLFEAGALSKALDDALVCPLLAPGMSPTDVGEPLAGFQMKRAAEQEEVFELVSTLNAALGTRAMGDKRLRTVFDKFWPDLEGMFKGLPPPPEDSVTAERGAPEKVDEILEAIRALSMRVAQQSARSRLRDVGAWQKELLGQSYLWSRSDEPEIREKVRKKAEQAAILDAIQRKREAEAAAETSIESDRSSSEE